LDVGTYDLTLQDDVENDEECLNIADCYKIFIDEKIQFEAHDYFVRSTISFYLSITGETGYLKEQLCKSLPVLSPLNKLSNFTYDVATDRDLEVISTLSSEELLNSYDSAQYKAACWILYDDSLSSSMETRSMIERYVIAVWFYTTHQDNKLLIPTKTCDFSNIICDDDGLVNEIISCKFCNIRKSVRFCF